ncbi:hypothetical protein KPH14_011191 [Odynerus spinipes]|uniref:ATP/GTP-binding protein-like 5 n=1 Tax=Odynerus spinipes TaxID=1348599 RepID=A0AAD9R972_9HYME|nr:hypothetical protein KPH14_011191 [Odynerus spinipes]
MARPKHRVNGDVCADCGAIEPGWASVNRAILLCDDCCGIHRSLGRHISHIKSLHKSIWNVHLLNMVHTLSESGANSIWEHFLLDPSHSKVSRRKPQAKDPVHPVKAEFIKAKHQHLAFILRPSKEECCSEEELSRQLHSSVRTSNLETSLRLLAQGANPNYFYKEKGTTPLHVAARAGQTLQIELLVVNGGNPNILDSNGQTPTEIAKMAGHLDLSERIKECMYEVTDRLTYYVCSRKPNHRLDEHLIIPACTSMAESNDSIVEGHNRLQMLSNHLLEELAMDVYDEVDRREMEAIWFSTATAPERCTVPFLPVNPQLSTTRNQGRQKLARFIPKEFVKLIIDLLTEAGRRYTFSSNIPLQDPVVLTLRKEQFGKHGSQMSDDEPLYDSVASDDDYALTSIDNTTMDFSTQLKIADEDAFIPLAKGLPSIVEVLKKQLTLSESTVRDLRNQIYALQSTVDHLMQENVGLKQIIERNKSSTDDILNGHIGGEQEPELEPVLDIKTSISRSNQRPASMYETREGLRKPNTWSTTICQTKRDTETLSRTNTQSLWEYGIPSLPPGEEVTRRTEQVTRRIQELWMAMQDPSQRESFVPCAERIRVAVAELTAIFPQNPIEENIKSALRQLNGNTGRLQAECSGLQRCTVTISFYKDNLLSLTWKSISNYCDKSKLIVMAENINCGGFVFYNNFDSANLAKVELVKTPEICDIAISESESRSCRSLSSDDIIDYEFNLWTKYDCHGTEYQNNNRTWFYFGVKACSPGICIRLNIVNLNKQVRMFSQGMCPVYKIIPGQLHWERIREKPTYKLDQTGSDFTLSFTYQTPENTKAITYFAFTYPFSYTDLQNYLRKIDMRMAKHYATSADDIYYHRECAIKSLEGRRLDVLTISSYHNILNVREDRFDNMFPEELEQRPFKFLDKKIIFISARVHPGETPSSFVLNGLLKFLLNREDQIALHLRRMYVFKLIPMLNPDGVAKGHYRMDTKGVNLNRMYLNPSESDHPTIYAARNLIRYYHHSYNIIKEQLSLELESTHIRNKNNVNIEGIQNLHTNVICDNATRLLQRVKLMTLNEKAKSDSGVRYECMFATKTLDNTCSSEGTFRIAEPDDFSKSSVNSGLYLYIDLHGHASKKGVFMYGNHFNDPEDTIMCMLLPKLMSINNPNFHFTSCNFTEKNMYLIDKRDGMSREGSGRVAVYKMTGLVRSYTLECNYNSGRLVNIVPARIREGVNKTASHLFVPPKYTPAVFEAVGAALGPSILDLTNNNPNSRLPNSQYRSLKGVRSYLKLTQMNTLSASCNKSAHKITLWQIIMHLYCKQNTLQRKKQNELLYRYGFFFSMLLCMLFATVQPYLGGTIDIASGNFIFWYFVVPLTYLEAGLLCTPQSLYMALKNGYLLIFVMVFMYAVMPFLAKIGTWLLVHSNVNIWLLKGMEVLYCMPPPFTSSLALCQLAQADLPTSVVTTLIGHFGGFFVSPILLYFVLGASTPPLVGVNIKEIIFSTLLPLSIGIVLQFSVVSPKAYSIIGIGRYSQGLLLIIAYYWFSDAVSTDVSSLQAIDILLCILIACIEQLFMCFLYWGLCSRWLPKDILLAALFVSTHKSVGLGGWILRSTYHGSAQGPAVNLPLSVLPVAQLLLGTLLACWIAPQHSLKN